MQICELPYRCQTVLHFEKGVPEVTPAPPPQSLYTLVTPHLWFCLLLIDYIFTYLQSYYNALLTDT